MWKMEIAAWPWMVSVWILGAGYPAGARNMDTIGTAHLCVWKSVRLHVSHLVVLDALAEEG